MIDLHVHILPGLDDGPGELEESLEMARLAAADGLRGLVATPHVITGAYDNSVQKILQAVEAFKEELRRRAIKLDLYPGAEYLLEPDLPRRLGEGRALTLNNGGRYLLVEFPAFSVPPFARATLYEIALLGITPVLAHPERNLEIQENPEILGDLCRRGCLAQLTAGSLLGLHGKGARGAARQIIARGHCTLLASDAHGATHRPPQLAPGAAELSALAGPAAAELFTVTNPRRLLGGQPPIPLREESSPPRGRGLWGRLFGPR